MLIKLLFVVSLTLDHGVTFHVYVGQLAPVHCSVSCGLGKEEHSLSDSNCRLPFLQYTVLFLTPIPQVAEH